MNVRPWSFVRIHAHGRLHFTEDGKVTHCGLRVRDSGETVEHPDLKAVGNCRRCMRWADIYEYKLREEYGDIEAAREAMKYISH